MSPLTRKQRILLLIAGLICLPFALLIGAGLWFTSRYVTSEPADAATASQEFAAARSRFSGQLPLIEYRGFEGPVIRRQPQAPRQTLHTVYVLTFDPSEEELSRIVVPVRVLNIITMGGRLRLTSVGELGSAGERITLEDLERFGPGLILDASASDVGTMIAADAALGTNTMGAHILVWTD